MACLNTSSPEFKNLASAAGLSEESTTAAIRQWQNIDPKNRVDQFPPLDWVEENYKKTSGSFNYAGKGEYTKDSVDSLHRIWESQHKTPKTGLNAGQVLSEVIAAGQIFSVEAVSSFQASDGTWTIAVKEPVWEEVQTEEPTAQDGTDIQTEEPAEVQAQTKRVKGYDVTFNKYGIEVTMPGLEDAGKITVLVSDGYADVTPGISQEEIDTFFGEEAFNEMLAVALDSLEKGLKISFPPGFNVPQSLGLINSQSHYYELARSSAAIVDLHTEESDSARYDTRTQKNANDTDYTIALAEDFTTPGEIATRKAAGAKYIGVQIDSTTDVEKIGKAVLDQLRVKGIFGALKLNFAGNAITNLREGQEAYDTLVEGVVKYLMDNGVEIALIQSGGQTGIDEAGIKAAIKLGIDYKMVVPKGYKMRVKSDGKKGYADVSSKQDFLERFAGIEYGKYSTKGAEGTSYENMPRIFTVSTLDGGGLFNSTKVLSLTDPQGDIDPDLIAAELSYLLTSGVLGIGDRIVLSSTMPVDALLAAMNALGRLSGRIVYEVPSSPNVVGSLNYSEEERAKLKNSGKVFVNEDSVIYPTYSVGFTEDELMLQKGSDNLSSSGLFRDTELRALAKAAIFRLSDVITKLNTVEGFADKLFSGDDVPAELRGVTSRRLMALSRADMLNPDAGGISFTSLMNYVLKELTFNPLKNRKPANKSFSTRDKMQLIYDNFESFIRLGYDALLSLEHLSFTPGFRDSTSEISRALAESDTEIFTQQDEQEIMEVFGSTLEYWQVGFRQVSVHNSLSQQVRTALSKVYELDEEGHIIRDEMGLPKTVETGEVVAKILSWGQGAFTPNDLIAKLRKYVGTEPWLNQLVGESDLNGTGNRTMGMLVQRVGDGYEARNDQFTTQFFNNFRKYFQPYAVTYRSGNEVQMKLINTNEYRDRVMKGITALAANSNGKEGPALRIWDREGKKLSKDFYRIEDLVGQFSEIPSSHSLYGVDEHDEIVKYFKEPTNPEYASKYQECLDIIREIYSLLDFDVPTTEQLRAVFTSHNAINEFSKTVVYLVRGINQQVKDGQIDLFERKEGNYNYSNYSKLAKTLEPVMLGGVESVSYEGGRMHYSYVNPAYLGTLVSQLRGEVENYNQFLEDEYGKYTGWFTWSAAFKGLVNPLMFGESEEDTSRWLNWWLETLEKDPEARKNFQHVVSLTDGGVTYVDKSDAQYLSSLVSMYFGDRRGKYAYYAVPIMSNKQSEEYIKFLRVKENYRGFITRKLLTNVFVQEVNRIRTVRERANQGISKSDKIQNLDEGRGEKFQFLDFLNEYLDGKAKDSPFGHALQTFVYADRNFGPSQVEGYDTEEAYFLDMIEEVIMEGMDAKFDEFITKASDAGFLTYTRDEDGNIASVSNIFRIENIIGTGATALDNLREYFWNSTFATMNIIQLAAGDLALFASTEDAQKRFAEFHSPGIKANEFARDISHPDRRVADKYERVMYLEDDAVTTDLHTQLSIIHKKISSDFKFLENAGIKSAKAQADYVQKLESVLKAFKNIKSTDGQGYTSPTGNRKKMHLFGTWDAANERAYNAVRNLDFDSGERVVWQPWKPFSYAQVSYRNIGNTNDRAGNPMYMPLMKVGVQHKYSEAVLETANELAGRVGVKTLLQALYDFMEESHGLVKNATGKWTGEPHDHGIDTIMFASGVKTGLTGAVDINGMTYEQALNALREAAKPVVEEDYNSMRVHRIPWSNYLKQQENPAHFQTSQQQGSQNRVLAIADTPDFDAEGKPNTVQIFSEDAGKFKYVEVPVREAKERYYKALEENVQISADRLMRRMGLDIPNQRFRNIILSRLLKEEMMKDGRYGSDMLWACSVNRNGEFNVPLSDPVQAGRIQQLLNSIIKNAVNKQEILGGPVVAVSSFGLVEDLKVRFRDKNGKTLMSKNEWEKNKGSYKSYEGYFNENYFAPAYIEAEAPIYDDFLIQDFGVYDSNGNWTGEIDVKKIENANPKMLYIYGLRLPTEYRYSTVPIKIVRFNNRMFGERLKLSADVVAMSGYDFDIDKETLERYYFKRTVKKEFNKQILRDAFNKGEFNYVDDVEEAYRYLTKDGETSLTRTQRRELREWYNSLPDASFAYTTQFEATSNDLKYQRNNNILVDTHLAFATAPQNVDQLFSAGNFDAQKKTGYLIAAMDNTGKSFAELSKLSAKQLKELAYSGKNIVFPQTQMEFHRQNMVAAKLIGVFAQANVSHSTVGLKTSSDGEQTTAFYMPKNSGFTMQDINGNTHSYRSSAFKSQYFAPIDRMMSFDGVTKISEMLASYVDASVDAVKDPVLNLLNINMVTVNVAVTLMRLGFDTETIGFFLTTPIIKELVRRYQAANANKTVRLSDVILEMQDEITHGAFDEGFEFSRDYFVRMHHIPMDTEHQQDNYQILELFARLQRMSDAFRMVTSMTRYNSITAAVGPFASHTLVHKIQDEKFSAATGGNPYISRGIDVVEAARDNPIVRAFHETAYGSRTSGRASMGLEGMLLGENLIQAGPFMQAVIREAWDMFGYLSEREAQALSDFAMSYYMNMGNPVIDLSYENRRRMIEDYAATEWPAVQEAYPDNLFVKAIRRRFNEKTGGYELSLSTKGMVEDNIEDLRKGWEDLYNDESEKMHEDPSKKSNAAVDLLVWNFFKAGFGFDPRTFTKVCPNAVRMALPGYYEHLDPDTRPDFRNHITNIVLQYMVNKGRVNLGMLTEETVPGLEKALEEAERGKKVIRKFPEGLNDMTGIGRYVNADGIPVYFYATTEYTGDGAAKANRFLTFRKIDKLGGYNNESFEIDPSAMVWEIESVYKPTTEAMQQEVHDDPFISADENAIDFSAVAYAPAVNPQEISNFDRLMRLLGFDSEKLHREDVGIAVAVLSLDNPNISEEAKQEVSRYGGSKFFKDLLKQIKDKDLTPEQVEDKINKANLCK